MRQDASTGDKQGGDDDPLEDTLGPPSGVRPRLAHRPHHTPPRGEREPMRVSTHVRERLRSSPRPLTSRKTTPNARAMPTYPGAGEDRTGWRTATRPLENMDRSEASRPA